VDNRRRGSGASDKHIRLSVQEGRLVEAETASGRLITGYVCSLDDYHIVVVDRYRPAEVILLNKGNTTIRIFHNECLDQERPEVRALIEEKVLPFRRSIERNLAKVVGS
jgi:hypothetical protein